MELFYYLLKLEEISFSGRSAVKPNHFNIYALKNDEYIKQRVALAKFGSIWECQLCYSISDFSHF